MTIDTRTPAEIAYDAARLSRAPIAQPAEAPHDVMTRIFEMLEEDEEQPEAPAEDDDSFYDTIGHPNCPDCTPQRDCPACTAKLDAAHQAVRDRAAAAPTATERAQILLEGLEMPDGDLIFDLIKDDRLVSYTWYRCIDWVLWRQANGLPVKRLNDDDDTPAAINARWNAARELLNRPHTWHSDNVSGREIGMGQTIADWERTPEQRAELREQNELMIKIFEAIERNMA